MKRALRKWLVMALLLLFLVPVWWYTVLPELIQIPKDLNIKTYLEGRVGVVNATYFDLDWNDIDVELSVEAKESHGDVVVLSTKTKVYERDKKVLMPEIYQVPEEIYGVNRKTFKYVSGYGKRNVEGYWSFPAGNLEKKTYDFYDFNINRTAPVRYIGDEIYEGIKVYVFESNLELYPLPSYYMNLSFFYSGSTKYFVEPSSGIIVDTRVNYTYYVKVPNLSEIPDDYSYTSSVYGKLRIVNATYFTPTSIFGDGNILKQIPMMEREFYMDEYNITSIGFGKIVGINGNVALIKVNTTTYDADENKPLPDIYQAPIVINGVDRNSFEHNPNFGDRQREGLFIFKLGVPMEKRNYRMWFEEFFSPMNISFAYEEVLCGINTYVYTMEVQNYPLKDLSTYGIKVPPGTELRYDGKFKFWVEPKSAIIIDNYRSSRVRLVGAGEEIGKEVFMLETRQTQKSVEELALSSILYNNLFPKSESLMPVVSLLMKAKDSSSNAATALNVGALINAAKYYIPAIFFFSGLAIGAIAVVGYRKYASVSFSSR
ncbi:MAG: porin PorA family protein [Candidatus Thermoplasmatota archaeon]